MKRLAIFAFSLIFSLCLTSGEAKQDCPLTINILSRDLFNEAGKEVDAKIIKDELEAMGHKVRLFDYLESTPIKSADINIFLAQFRTELFFKAKLNWFLANPDFCASRPEDIRKFDLVLCKTQEAMRIFAPYSQETYFLGFMSHNFYNGSIKKNYDKFLHLAGKSVMKGTDEVVKTWKNHPEFPLLTLIKRDATNVPPLKNVKLITNYLPRKALIKEQNECGFHVCPSKTEGFGHYLMEAMAVGAVVITTDAPPMNEFILDKRCLVKYKDTSQQYYAITYRVDERDLAKKIKALRKLPLEELEAIGLANQELYHMKVNDFKESFKRLMDQVSHSKVFN